MELIQNCGLQMTVLVQQFVHQKVNVRDLQNQNNSENQHNIFKNTNRPRYQNLRDRQRKNCEFPNSRIILSISKQNFSNILVCWFPKLQYLSE